MNDCGQRIDWSLYCVVPRGGLRLLWSMSEEEGCEEKVVFSRPQQFRSVLIDGLSPFILMDRGEGADNNIKGIEMDWYYNIITGSLKNFPFNFVRGCSSSSSSSVDLHSAMNYVVGVVVRFPIQSKRPINP